MKAPNIAYNYGVDLINKVYENIRIDQENTKVDRKLKENWHEVNKIFRDVFLSKEIAHVLRLPTGTGKTANITQWIQYIAYYTLGFKTEGIDGIVLLAQEYENGINELERQIEKFNKFGLKHIKLEGKSRICKMKNDPLVKTALEANLALNYMCNKDNGSCKVDCELYQKYTELFKGGFLVSVHHQLNKFLPIFLQKLNKIILIIDENFETAIKSYFTIGLDDLSRNIEFLERVLKKKVKYRTIVVKTTKKRKGFTYKREIKNIFFHKENVELLFEFLSLLYKGITKELDYEELETFIEILDFLDATISTLNNEGWHEFETGEVKPFSKFLFYELNSFIKNYQFQKRTNPKNLKTWLEKAIMRMRNKESGKYYLSFMFFDLAGIYDLIKQGKIDKIIINDATANIPILEKILGLQIVDHYKGLYSNEIEIHQLKQEIKGIKGDYAKYPKSSINRPSTLKLLYGDVKASINAFSEMEEYLFVSRKMDLNHYRMSLKQYITPISTKFKYEDYPLNSTNKYENCNLVLIFGTPEVSKYNNEREAGLLGFKPEEYRKRCRKIKIKQAMGRIFRGTDKKIVILLTGVDLGLDLPINYYYSHKEFVSAMNKIAQAQAQKTIVEKMTDFLQKNEYITSDEYAKIYSISPQYASKKLKIFEKKGILKVKTVERGRKLFYI